MSMTLEASYEDRFLIFKLMQPALQCHVCKSGPIDTTDASKLITYGKVWDLLDLSVFENLTQSEFIDLLKNTKVLPVEFKSDTLRYVVELFFTRGYAINLFYGCITLLNKLISLANVNNVKLNQTDTTELSDLKTVELTFDQLQGVMLVLVSNKICKAEFSTQEGKTVIHGVATDTPKTLTDYNRFVRILDALNLTQVLTGAGSIEPYKDTIESEMHTNDIAYLLDLVAQRSTNVNFAQHKLAGIIKALS